MPAEQLVVPDWKRPAMIGYLVILLSFGVLGGWSAFARIDSAVVAPGVVTVESNRKTIQHFEGGIVLEIDVREGQHVEANQLLFRLDATQPRANAEVARNQLVAGLAQEARLIAERDGAADIALPDDFAATMDHPVVKSNIADQRKQFAERRAALKGQISILQSKVVHYETEIQGLNDEKASTLRQLESIEGELVDLRHLLGQGLIPRPRVLAHERERSRLEGIVGRSTADAAKAQNGIGEARLQIDQLQKKFSEDVNAALLEVRQKIADLREKVTVAQDVLKRIEIRAPRAGLVQNVRVTTVGGVVKAGEPLLDLVPDGDGLVVNAQVSTLDINVVRADMPAEVRFTSFHADVLPIIMGRVTTVSGDRMTDELSKQPYFLARVVVKENEIPSEIRGRITAGMPADVVIPTGERTVVDYLIRPLQNRARKALREQ